MSFQFELNIFKDIIEKYPVWDELHKYLESENGGLFKIIDSNEDGFCLIRYEKGITKMDLPHSRWFRSVVWNTKTNQPLCIAPPKASTEEFPYKTFKEVSDAGVLCQELFEGFMINCFKVVGDKRLHITSRSKLNAAGNFYSKKSFRELFIESYMNINNCQDYTESYIQDNSDEIDSPDSSKKEVSIFYSFLVQHKEHQIVKLNTNNSIYLVHKGVVYEDGHVEIFDSPKTEKGILNIENLTLEHKNMKDSYLKITTQENNINDDLSEVSRWIKNELLDRDYLFQGLVFKDVFGNRWRFRSEKYMAVKTLRGNSPSIIERFAQLYTQNLIGKYLEYYTEDIIHMTIIMMCMDGIIKIIYDNYVDLHILKTKKADEVDKMFLPHLYNIHGIYLSNLKPNNKKINFDEIKVYFHKQPWQRLVFLIKKIIAKANEDL